MWVRLTVTAVFDAQGRLEHTMAIVFEIEQRRRAEQALREREALFGKLADHVPGVLFQFHVDTQQWARVPYCSEGIRAVYELAPEAVRENGRLMIERVVTTQRQRVWQSIQASARTLENWHAEYEVELPLAGRRWHEGHAAPERLPDGGTWWHGYITDITERKLADAALLIAQSAERANAAKAEFLSRMSHELRTPLNAVLGFSQLLLCDTAKPLPADQRARVGHIERAGQHLLSMIGDVLDLSRIDAGRLPLVLQPLGLRALVDEAFALVTPTARGCGVALQQQHGEADLHVRADPMRLRQVLVNLLSNAVKYNQPGGRVVVETRAAGVERVRVSVSDTGIGLTQQQQQHLFEPFNRLGAERSSVEGTGLGLAITRRLLELMDGRIRVDSELGRGSTFEIELPSAAPRSLASTPPQAAAPAHGGALHRVLYAEDNRLNVELIEQLLELRSGCELRVARNGREAIAHARSQPPDLLLIDMHLGDMTGLDVLEALRGDAALIGVPRIALSADALPQNVQAARDAGFDDYLTKPVDIAELLRCLDRHLDRRRGAADAAVV